LATAGASWEHVIAVNSYHVSSPEDVNQIMTERFRHHIPDAIRPVLYAHRMLHASVADLHQYRPCPRVGHGWYSVINLQQISGKPATRSRFWRNEEELQFATQVVGTDTAGSLTIAT
jgi:hypothetical protein